MYYPVVAATHLAWIASLAFLISPQAPVIWPLIACYLALQVVRYWVIASLGRFWTHRIITVPGAPITRTGPYRYVSHPNYAVTLIETFVLQLAFGALALAVIMTCCGGSCSEPRSSLRTRHFHPDACEPSCEQGALAS